MGDLIYDITTTRMNYDDLFVYQMKWYKRLWYFFFPKKLTWEELEKARKKMKW